MNHSHPAFKNAPRTVRQKVHKQSAQKFLRHMFNCWCVYRCRTGDIRDESTLDELHADFLRGSRGQIPVTSKEFSEILEAAGFQRHDVNGANGFSGIALKVRPRLVMPLGRFEA